MLEWYSDGGVWMHVVLAVGLVTVAACGVPWMSLKGRAAWRPAVGGVVATLGLCLAGTLIGVYSGLTSSPADSESLRMALGVSVTPVALACFLSALGGGLLGCRAWLAGRVAVRG